ncbi:hypothetical protein ACFQZT_24590 [Paenibacillus sp. GCM10027628]
MLAVILPSCHGYAFCSYAAFIGQVNLISFCPYTCLPCRVIFIWKTAR